MAQKQVSSDEELDIAEHSLSVYPYHSLLTDHRNNWKKFSALSQKSTLHQMRYQKPSSTLVQVQNESQIQMASFFTDAYRNKAKRSAQRTNFNNIKNYGNPSLSDKLFIKKRANECKLQSTYNSSTNSAHSRLTDSDLLRKNSNTLRRRYNKVLHAFRETAHLFFQSISIKNDNLHSISTTLEGTNATKQENSIDSPTPTTKTQIVEMPESNSSSIININRALENGGKFGSLVEFMCYEAYEAHEMGTILIGDMSERQCAAERYVICMSNSRWKALRSVICKQIPETSLVSGKIPQPIQLILLKPLQINSDASSSAGSHYQTIVVVASAVMISKSRSDT